MPEPIKQNAFSYQKLRCIQISTVYFFTLIIQELIHFPRAGWTGFSLMMIYAGFSSGIAISRAYHRFLGALLGLFSGYILWFIGYVDWRSLIIILPLTVYFAYFLTGRAYSIPTIFTVNTSVIGFGYFNTNANATISEFMIDYTLCTFLAFGIILAFEYFWFRHYNMMRRFISDTQAEVISHLYQLVRLLNQEKIRRTIWFNSCVQLTNSLTQVNLLINSSQFMTKSEQVVGDEFNQFISLTKQIFVHLKALYVAFHTEQYNKFDYLKLLDQVQANLTVLNTLVIERKITSITDGVIHAIPD